MVNNYNMKAGGEYNNSNIFDMSTHYCLLYYVDLYLIVLSLDYLIHFNACFFNLVVLRGFGVGV